MRGGGVRMWAELVDGVRPEDTGRAWWLLARQHVGPIPASTVCVTARIEAMLKGVDGNTLAVMNRIEGSASRARRNGTLCACYLFVGILRSIATRASSLRKNKTSRVTPSHSARLCSLQAVAIPLRLTLRTFCNPYQIWNIKRQHSVWRRRPRSPRRATACHLWPPHGAGWRGLLPRCANISDIRG